MKPFQWAVGWAVTQVDTPANVGFYAIRNTQYHSPGSWAANPGDNLRTTGTDDATANPMKNGPCGPSEGKRVMGFEPTTFTLAT